jgi:hypothetical protein
LLKNKINSPSGLSYLSLIFKKRKTVLGSLVGAEGAERPMHRQQPAKPVLSQHEVLVFIHPTAEEFIDRGMNKICVG